MERQGPRRNPAEAPRPAFLEAAPKTSTVPFLWVRTTLGHQGPCIQCYPHPSLAVGSSAHHWD